MCACSIDIGTCFLCSAKQDDNGQIQLKSIRDAFLDLENDSSIKNMLKMSKVNFIEAGDKLYIVGEDALVLANMFKREARRPLAKGVISPGELEAEKILLILLENVIGKATVPGEICFFSVPGNPSDRNADVVYHQAMFSKLIGSLEYKPLAMNESAAIVYSNAAKENFSALALSFGAGLVNVALLYQTVVGMSFSIQNCLSKDFPVMTDTGIKEIQNIKKGDNIIDAVGNVVPVLDIINNGKKDQLLEITFNNMSAFPCKMTPDHRVLVKNKFSWDWKHASELKIGDIVGVPNIKSSINHNTYYFGRKDGENITTTKSRKLGKFLGFFLGDGSTFLYKSNSGHNGGMVSLGFNIKYSDLIEKYTEVISDLFNRTVSIVENQEENLIKLQLHSYHIARHLKEKYYDENNEKIIPFAISEIPDQMAMGLLEGLFDSDGCSSFLNKHIDGTYGGYRLAFDNTSLNLIYLVHNLLNRFGINHSIIKREPRIGGINKKGIQIYGKKPCYSVYICDAVSLAKYNTLKLLEHGGLDIETKHDFIEYTIFSIENIVYEGDIFDLKVDSEYHSFCSPSIIVHNCGDHIDESAARATGSTASRIQAIKEKGLNLMNPEEGDPKTVREREALVIYYKSLILRVLDSIRKEFNKRSGTIELPNSIPMILSGGTALPKGFKELFEIGFNTVKDKFEIPISEVRMASDPLRAVAQGLLVAALNHDGK